MAKYVSKEERKKKQKMRNKIEESWNKLAKLAKAHLAEGSRFNKLCREEYGVHWQSIESLKDDDRIIDTIDYGYDGLSFKEFDAKVKGAMEEIKDGQIREM